MKLRTTCPACNSALSVKPELVGRTVRCPACKVPFTIESVRTPTSEKSHDDGMEASLSKDSADQSLAAAQTEVLPSTIARFEIREKLGEGGFGSVYRAYDPVLDRDTALKVPHRFSSVPQQYDRILKEAKAAARLRHPNIVAVFEVGSSLELPYIAAEFVKGRTLSAVMKENSDDSVADLRQRIEWVIAIAHGLSYAHREGIVHRDVKPHNVLIDETGRALLADFGLAMQQTEAESDERKNAIVGTLGYLSPEQAAGDQSQVGPPADQYALGVVLFEILTGRRPFEGNSYSLITQIINDAVPRPSTVAENVSPDLECICLKALSRDVSNRYESCDHLADDLQRWLDGELVEATNPTWLRRVIHWGRRRPQLAAWAITAASLILVATGTTITIAIQQKLENDRLAAAAETLKEETNAVTVESEAAKAALTKAEQARIAAQARSEAVEYAEELDRIRAAIADNRVFDAHALLDRIPWSKRHVEHGLLRREAMGTPYLIRHGGDVVKLTWSRDGRILASVGNEGTIRFWSGETGEPLGAQNFQGHRDVDAEFSPVADVLWTVVGDRRAKTAVLQSWKFVEAEAGVRLERNNQQVQFDLPKASLCVDPSGKVASVIGTAKDGEPGLMICDLASPELKITLKPTGLPSRMIDAAFRNTGTKLVCRGIAVISPGPAEFEHFEVDYVTGAVTPFEPPEVPVVADGNVIPVSTETIAPPEYFRGERSHLELRGPDRNEQVRQTASLEVAKGWLVKGFQNGRIEYPNQFDKNWHGHSFSISCFAQRPDGKCLASADNSGEIRIWPTALQTRFGVAQNQLGTKPLGRVSHNHDGSLAVCAVPQDESGELPLWSTTTGEISIRLAGHKGGIRVVQFHPANDQLISVDGEMVVRLWDLVDGKVIRQWSPKLGVIEDAAFAPDGKSLAIVGESDLQPQAATPDTKVASATAGIVTLWNPETGTQTFSMTGHTGKVVRAAFVPDGTQLFTASADGSVRGWSPVDGKELVKFDCEEFVPVDLAVSETTVGVVAAEVCEGTRSPRSQIIAWNRADKSKRYTIPGAEWPFRTLDFSDDGKRLVTVSDSEAAIRDAQSGTHLHNLPLSMTARTAFEDRSNTVMAMVPVTEQREATRTVCKSVVESQLSETLNGNTAFDMEQDMIRLTAGKITNATWIEFSPMTGSSMPEGLLPGTVYFIEEVNDITFRVCSDKERTRRVDILQPGTGTIEALIVTARNVFEQVPYTYSVTIMKRENRERLYRIQNPVIVGPLPFHAQFLSRTTGVLFSDAATGRVFDATAPCAVQELTGIGASIEGFTVNQTGEAIASFGAMNSACEQWAKINVWNPTTGKLINSIRRTNERIRAMAFHPSSGHLIVAAETLLSGTNGNSTGKAPAASASQIHLIDPANGEPTLRFPADPLKSPIVELAVSIDPPLLLSRDEQNTLQLWNLTDGVLIRSSAMACSPITRIALSPDGRIAMIQDATSVTACLTESLDQRWPLSVQQPEDDQSGYSEPVTAFELTEDQSQLIGRTAFGLTSNRSIPFVVNLSELTKSLTTDGGSDDRELQTLLPTESVPWLKNADNTLFYDLTESYSDFTGLNQLHGGEPSAAPPHFLSALHGTERLTSVVQRNGRLYGKFGNSTILQWYPTAARRLRDQFRITTPPSTGITGTAPAKISPVAPKLRLSVSAPTAPAAVEHAPPRPAAPQALPAPEAPAPPAQPALPAPVAAPERLVDPEPTVRLVAEWARKYQAELTLRRPGWVSVVSATEALPAEPYVISSIKIPESAQGLTDEGLELVGQLQALKTLHLRTTTSQISDAGVAKLVTSWNLNELNLHACPITDNALGLLNQLRLLSHLDIGYNQNITDAGIDHLLQVPRLTILNLSNTRVSNEGLRRLVGLKQLRHLDVTGLNITDETVRWMGQQLPDCKFIDRGVPR